MTAFLRLAVAVFLLAALVPIVRGEGRPNVLIVMADDCTYNDLPIYGGENAKTPTIDRLAREGLTFNRAYLSEAICQPCRAELYTGRFPLRNGCAWNHSASRPNVKSIPHYLAPLGYRVGLAGKVHVRPATAFPFEKVEGFDDNCVRAPTKEHHVRGIRHFMDRDERPFCLVVALVEPHVPWVMGDASQYPPEKLKLPLNLADTPETRRDFGRYLAEMTYMDGQLADILAALDASGKAKSTLVLFTSEQGSQFPGNKWTTWDTGLHTALVARWPGQIPAGKRSDAIVQYADVLPTLLDLAGGVPAGDTFDGTSFRDGLAGKTDRHRQFAYGLLNNLPEGPPYPTRTVSDGRHRYIRNLMPDEIYIEQHIMGLVGGSAAHNPYWSSWPREAVNSRQTYELVRRYMRRPAEQLYDTAGDPYELNNLAGDPDHAAIQARLAAELDRWMAEQRDPGAAMDSPKVLQAARRGEHLYGPDTPPSGKAAGKGTAKPN